MKAASPPGTLMRIKIATLSPQPHHKHVVAKVKVPFPLPDVDIAKAEVRKRIITPQGISRPAPDSGYSFGMGMDQDALFLTAEEIKDVMSSTAFWLVVRENIGGVGKVPRKGDGWRLRA